LIILAVSFIATAILFGIVIHSGCNHPPLKYPLIGDISSRYINGLAQMGYREVCLSLTTQGPFKWDNESDLGVSDLLGAWANEADHDGVVYFRRDKDAVWQERAREVLHSVEQISDQISAQFGMVCCSADSANGRRIPIYIPENAQEYAEVLASLCDGLKMPTDDKGCSVIKIGPLGCLNKGIVIHPDLFESGKDYEQTLRKELARYAYYSSVDYNQEIDHPAWFTEGLLKYLSGDCDTTMTRNMSEMAEKVFDPGTTQVSEDAASRIGSSFIDFIVHEKGEEVLSSVIQGSFSENLETAFSDEGIDLEALKQEWIQSLQVQGNILSE